MTGVVRVRPERVILAGLLNSGRLVELMVIVPLSIVILESMSSVFSPLTRAYDPDSYSTFPYVLYISMDERDLMSTLFGSGTIVNLVMNGFGQP